MIRDKLNAVGEQNERAVSPVIGVILMVAITVILAAIIGTFVLGLGDQVQTNAQAGADVAFDKANDQVKISYNNNQNADYLMVNVTDAQGQTATYRMNSPGATIKLGGAPATADADSDTADTATQTLSGAVTAAPVGYAANTTDDIATAGNGDSAPYEFGLQNGGDDDVTVVVTAVKGSTTTVIANEDSTV